MKKRFLIGTLLTGIFAVTGLAQPSWSNTLTDEELLAVLNPYNAGSTGSGSKFLMRLQDTNVSSVAPEEVYFPQSVAAGPSDHQFMYDGSNRFQASNPEGDYTRKRLSNKSFKPSDTASMYANLRVTADLFQNDLMALIRQHPNDRSLQQLASHYMETTTESPLSYAPIGEKMKNAYYTRFQEESVTYRMMVMGYYRANGGWNFTAKHPDIVWHEAGHAILDAARPEYLSNSPEAGTFHEAWADINTFFTALSFGSLRHQVLADTRGDLNQPNFIAHMAEAFGSSVMGSDTGLRDMDDDIAVGEASGDHDTSRILSGIIYDINNSAYKDRVRKSGRPADDLGNVSKTLRQNWIYTTSQLNNVPSFMHVGTVLQDSFSSTTDDIVLPWKSYIQEEFEESKITFKSASDSQGLKDTVDSWNSQDISVQDWHAVKGKKHLSLKPEEIIYDFD